MRCGLETSRYDIYRDVQVACYVGAVCILYLSRRFFLREGGGGGYRDTHAPIISL